MGRYPDDRFHIILRKFFFTILIFIDLWGRPMSVLSTCYLAPLPLISRLYLICPSAQATGHPDALSDTRFTYFLSICFGRYLCYYFWVAFSLSYAVSVLGADLP